MQLRHGSGKTAVLVERIIHKIIDDKIDIDKILVVTFTNAAASEMRGRILEAIYKKIDENPNDIHLQKQITLLNKASICTIHSFCLDVIRNYFYEIDISANFRIGDSAEVELLKQDVLEELLEEKYINKEKNFLKLIDTFATYKGDEKLKEIILKIYDYIQSSPFPRDWLEQKVQMFNMQEDIDFSDTIWGVLLLNELKEELIQARLRLEGVRKNLKRYSELEKYSDIILSDIEKIKELEDYIEHKKYKDKEIQIKINSNNKIENKKEQLKENINLDYKIENKSEQLQENICSNDKRKNKEDIIENLWDKIYISCNELKFDKWPVDKKVTITYKEEAKQIRDKVKKDITSSINNILCDSNNARKDIFEMYDLLNILKNIVIEFDDNFSKKKREKNIIDFHDIEHLALNILIKKNEKGEYKSSEIAKIISDKFEEIAIDEYQDSNLVQEYILNSISNGRNIFMVGDVKQSIYKFRQARPELFLEKYENYEKIENDKEKDIKNEVKNNIEDIAKNEVDNNIEENINTEKEIQGQKIQLFKNFRSRRNILDITNLVFKDIMSKDIGDINYNEEEYLNLGASYEEPKDKNISNYAGITELNVIDLKQDEPQYAEQDEEPVEKTIIEAKFVANKIKELLNSKYMVYDKNKGYRPIAYKDIVILLRTTSNIAPVYEKELIELDFPVFCDTSTQYLESTEIQTILSILKIIDNPLQDIALVSVLRSPIGNFTDNELLEIRLADKNTLFYNSLIKAKLSVKKDLRMKIERFLNYLEKWKKDEKKKTLDELIWEIYGDTNYYNYVGLLSNGKLRQANLKILFQRAKQYEDASFKGLYNFIQFIDKLRSSSGDMNAAKIIGENDNVIRIMSIHKSKGLEFPVVFLSSTGKKFNMQDLNENILLHQDLGFGPKYIDSVRRIEYNTLAKEAIKIKSKIETISEEMRVLYVALTRAKEKLIITGISNDLEKSIKQKEELLEIYKQENEEKINKGLVKKYISYLDWLELVYLNNKENIKDIMIFQKYNYKDIIKEDYTKLPEDILNKILKNKEDKNKIENIKNTLNWEYQNKLASKIPTIISITKIKEMKNEESIYEITETDFKKSNLKTKKKEQINEENLKDKELQNKEIYGKELEIPNFMKKEKVTTARKGSIIHLCIQKLDEKRDYSQIELEELINDLYEREIITKIEKETININILLKYLNSNLWKKLKKAKEIHKEEPFYMEMPAKEIYEKQYSKEELENLDENIIVQGIIDLYYLNENDELILVDYKTDYIEKGEENNLIEKYKVQLELYKQALEKSLNRKVDKVIIYSTYFGEIEVK